MVITTGAKRVTLTGYRAHQNAGHGLLIEEDASQIIGTAMTLESNVLDGLHIVSSAIGSPTDITITGLISGDIRAVKQDSGIEIDGTTGTPDNITITAARFPGITNKVVFTGTVGQNIQIEENSDSASYSGTDDVNVLLDADASTNTASFSVQKNSADPSAATALFEVEEDGDVRVYNQGGSGFSRLIVRAGAAQSSTALQLWQNNGGAVLTKIDESGGIVPRGLSLASLGASTNGTIFYCIDCNSGTAPCTGGGTGSIAVRENSQWNCK